LDAERIVAIGAEPPRVRITGNIKYDIALEPMSSAEERALRNDLGLDEAPVLMAGSTHRGEEDIVIEAFRRARQQVPTLRLLLAPRHLERLEEIEALLHKHGLTVQRRSRGHRPAPSREACVLLIDTIGELARLYAVGTVVFVGGSFVPIGGHNVLEPAAHRQAIVFGPHMHNFEEIATALVEAGGALQVQTPDALSHSVLALLQQPKRRQRLGAAAYQVLHTNQGAVTRTIELIEPFLSQPTHI